MDEKKLTLTKDNLLIFILLMALVLYGAALVMLCAASLGATEKNPAEVNKMWVDLFSAIGPVLALHAGAWLGLPSDRQLTARPKDVDGWRGWVTGFYFLCLLVAFVVAALSKFPHSAITEMGSSLMGLVVGSITVFYTRS